MTDAQLAIYITRLQTAGDDCRRQLAEVKHTLEVQGVTITDIIIRDKKPNNRFLGLF